MHPTLSFLSWRFQKGYKYSCSSYGSLTYVREWLHHRSFFKRTPCVVKNTLVEQWIGLTNSVEGWCERHCSQIDCAYTLCMNKGCYILFVYRSRYICLVCPTFDVFEEMITKWGCKVSSFDLMFEGPPVGFERPKRLKRPERDKLGK